MAMVPFVLAPEGNGVSAHPTRSRSVSDAPLRQAPPPHAAVRGRRKGLHERARVSVAARGRHEKGGRGRRYGNRRVQQIEEKNTPLYALEGCVCEPM
jgi:hypothetical protein